MILRWVALALLFFALPVWAAPTFVADDLFTPGGGGDEIVDSFDATGAAYLRVTVFATNGVSLVSIAYAAQTPTLIASSANGDILGVYHLLAPTSGTQTLDIQFSGNSPRIGAYIEAWSGTHASAPAGTAVTNTGESNAPTVTVSSDTGQTVSGSCWIASGADGVSSAGTGQTEHENVTNWVDSSISTSAVEKNGASSVQLDWSTTNVDSPTWFTVAIPIIPSAGGASGLLRRRRS